MPSETTTPNIGLQIPAFNQSNWQVPTNYNWNLLDLIFSGQITVPGLSVGNLAITNIGAQIALVFVAETPSGVVPGNVYNLTYLPSVTIGFFFNGVLQRPTLDYVQSGTTITMNGATSTGDSVFAVYLKQTGSEITPSITAAFGEVPSGVINGTNRTFMLTVSPIVNSLTLIKNGVFQTPNVDYTLSGQTITFTLAPTEGDGLYAQGIS